MKKFENVLDDLPGYGKTILPKKFTMNRGEETSTALKNPTALASNRQKSTKFDITYFHSRREICQNLNLPLKIKKL